MWVNLEVTFHFPTFVLVSFLTVSLLNVGEKLVLKEHILVIICVMRRRFKVASGTALSALFDDRNDKL